MIQINRVRSKKDWSAFIDFQWQVNATDPAWVPPLRIAVKDLLDVTKNPFWRHAQMVPLLAYENGKVVGRVIGVIDEDHNRFQEEKTAFFGFFESIDDPAVIDALMKEVSSWAKNEGMNTLRGPMNPSSNHECGLLVEGFGSTPSVMTTYNPPYYGSLLEKAGFSKTKDLYAYEMQTADSMERFSDKIFQQAERLLAAGHVKFRTPDLSKWDEEVENILTVYNDAWEKNWGFVPMDPVEFKHMAKDMKMILDPNLLLLAEAKGEVIAFSLALPDVNQAQIKIKDGKLFPVGLFKLLWNLKGPRKRQVVDRCRIITLGIKKKYQELGVGPLFYVETLKRAIKGGYRSGEASWILEDNVPMNKALQRMGATRTKVYRIYDRAI